MWLEKYNWLRKRYYENTYNRKYAPYNISVYRQMLTRIELNSEASWRPFFEHSLNSHTNPYVYVRHDIDTLECLESVPRLIEVDEQFSIVPGVFFLVNEETYSLKACRNIATDLISKGFVVGLHSTCYLSDDYLIAFDNEIKKFNSVLGFRPHTFNVHGYGNYRLDARLKFYSDITTRYREFGFDYSDCCTAMREYKYIIEDCHWCNKMSARFIKDDFMFPEKYVLSGGNLVLTHPCYWGVGE